MGLASWAGPGSAQGDAFDRLVAAFDTLDGSDAFVHPDAMAAVAASDKRAERAALDDVVALVATAVQRLDSGQTTDDALFGRIVDAWSSEPPDSPDARNRAGRRADPHRVDVEPDGRARLGVRRPARAPGDIWTRVADGDGDLAQRCALESTRMAQRSIMSRAVLAPVDFDTGDVTLSRARRLDDRHAAAAAEHLGRARTGTLGSRPMAPPPACRPERAAFAHAGDGVRARQAFLPRPAVLAGGDDGRDDPSARPVRDDARGGPATRRPVPAQIGGVARAADACPVDYVSCRGRFTTAPSLTMTAMFLSGSASSARFRRRPCRDLIRRRAETGWYFPA